ncbi:hypothetical protein HU811_26780 [Pseudomonas sp. SWRI196]|uniref:Uncharacterized protein n=1 Tax=Pseudomonas tehranensis TaxID=2745502 RepID=A0ABR6V0Z5_9PSED|nr:hypothetical protein [Pseudomonas tehranensis]
MNLTAPSVKEAGGTAPNQQLNPVAGKDNLTVVIPDYGVQPGDQVSVTWTGTAGDGSYTTPVQILPPNREITMPVSVIAYNLGKPVTVTYTVTRGNESPPSDSLNLAVQAMPEASLTIPLIPQAAQGGIGSELDLGSFAGDARVTVAPWPLIAAGQRVWLSCEGIASDGSDYTIPLLTDSEVSSGQVTAGLSTPLLRSELEKLRDGSELKVVLLVTFNRSSNQSEAVAFPLRRYTKSGFSEHYTPFTAGDMNGWSPFVNVSVKNQAGNYYCELASRASGVAYIYRTDLPLISGKRFRISMRARSVSPDAQLVFRRDGTDKTWGGFTSEWSALSYEFNVSSPLRNMQIISSGVPGFHTIDIDDILIRLV